VKPELGQVAEQSNPIGACQVGRSGVVAGERHATDLGYFQLRLLERLLTYSRPPKYPAASTTITRRIARDSGRVLCVAIGAAITVIIEEYMSNGNRCLAERLVGEVDVMRAGGLHPGGAPTFVPERAGNCGHQRSTMDSPNGFRPRPAQVGPRRSARDAEGGCAAT
jgi:hypothetical protein